MKRERAPAPVTSRTEHRERWRHARRVPTTTTTTTRLKFDAAAPRRTRRRPGKRRRTGRDNERTEAHTRRSRDCSASSSSVVCVNPNCNWFISQLQRWIKYFYKVFQLQNTKYFVKKFFKYFSQLLGYECKIQNTFWEPLKYKLQIMYFKYIFQLLVFQLLHNTG